MNRDHKQYQHYMINHLKKLSEPLSMLILAVVIGSLAALCAILFKALVAIFHNILFFGKVSLVFNETVHTLPSIWGMGVIFVPVFGGIIVVWLLQRFARNERGLSVSEILYKIHWQECKIKPSVAIAKAFASTVSIGSGASIGREGPVIQIGAALSALLGEFISLSIQQKKILIAAGIAAGTAGIFNAPIAGIAFAIELFLTSINIFSFIVIIISAIMAAFIEGILIGNSRIFTVDVTYHFNNYSTLLIHLSLFILLGILIGVISVLFIRGIYWFEDLFNFMFKNAYIRHMIGMLIIGIMFYLLLCFYGDYYIEGIGFATIQDCLNFIMKNPWLLLLIFICKLLATCLSLGSGASGGIFSPALFLGATLGTIFGLVVNYLFPSIDISPVIFTILGMGGMVGSATGAVMTAVILTFEMTREIYSVLPMMVTVIIAYLVRRQICKESIYTLRLAQYKAYHSS